MSNFIPMGSNTAAPPPAPSITTTTIKEYDQGQAVNWVHIPNIKPLEVVLKAFDGKHPFVCYSCHQEIAEPQLIGAAETRGKHCSDCIHIPDGIRAVIITHRVMRKSKNYPDGIRKVRVVAFPAEIDDYVQELSRVYGTIEVESIYPLDDDAREAIYTHVESLVEGDAKIEDVEAVTDVFTRRMEG